MDGRNWWCALVIAASAIALVVTTSSGSWTGDTAHVLLAARGQHVAAAPLFDALASVFSLLPVGEPAFRLGILAALLGALTLGGVVAAAHALMPKDPVAGVVGAAVLFLAPAFRDAAAFATPAMLGAAGATWSIACSLRFARGRDIRDAVAALALTGVVIGSSPWLGAVLAVAIGTGLARAGARREVLALVAACIGIGVVVLWLDARGSLPSFRGSLVALANTGRGAGAIVVGAGLLGTAFAAITSMPRVGWLAAPTLLALAHDVVVGDSGPVSLALLAIGCAIIPRALVRVAAATATGVRRDLVALGAGIPLVGVAALTGATLGVDDPAATPAHLAHDLLDAVPPGPGVFISTRPATWLAVQHEMTIAGARPDLTLVPPLPASQADVVAATALRQAHVVAADAAAFGRLDIARAIPRGRAFQLLGESAPLPASVLGPATYATPTGAQEAILLALERARFEAANGRLDAAARAAGLESRFGAGDLAILGATVPSKARPALFGFLPTAHTPIGPWLLETFGDDLAWVAGIAVPALPPGSPVPRQLHALWREILAGTRSPDDPAIASLGDDAVRATRELFRKK